jgi:hypothetical protein
MISPEVAMDDSEEEEAEEELGEPGDTERRARVERALDTVRDLLSPDEIEEHRRMLLFLARTHPSLSTWIEDIRPRPVPDESGTVEKKDRAALKAAAARRASGQRGNG